jgi:hypothetical protein
MVFKVLAVNFTSLGRDWSSSNNVAGHVLVKFANQYKCSEAFDLEIL